MLGTALIDPLIRRIRNAMEGRRMAVGTPRCDCK